MKVVRISITHLGEKCDSYHQNFPCWQNRAVEDVYAWQKMNIYVHDGAAEDQDTAIILQIHKYRTLSG